MMRARALAYPDTFRELGRLTVLALCVLPYVLMGLGFAACAVGLVAIFVISIIKAALTGLGVAS